MWDDFHPYVYVTGDFGVHWTPLVRGLPDDQYVFVVREDPREPRLLFAGTRSTVYASFDAGTDWLPLALDLPGAQMHDIAIDPRQGEVVVASHGRAFWILDNLALLEQLAHDPPRRTEGAQLFAPEAAWLTHAYGAAAFAPPGTGENPAFGATIFFNVPPAYDGKTPVTLAVLDAAGATVRSFQLHLKKKHAKKVPPEIRGELDAIHQRALDLADLTAIEPGMNKFQWDLRYAPATEVAGFHEPLADDFRASVDGPTIVPGAYSVVLQYGGLKLTQTLAVRLDPRLHPAAGDLDARLALEMRVHETLDKLNSTINAALAATQKLPPEKRPALETAIAGLVQLDIHSSEGDLLHETKVRSHLAFLANELETAYEKPTAAEYAAFDELKAQADAGVARLEGFLSSM
jgi:hypothetical protein